MKKMNKWIVMGMAALMLTVTSALLPVQAADIDQSKVVNIDASEPILALGADLSEEQKQTVLSLMNLTNDDLNNMKVITITNSMEHEYLDSYIDPAVIGTKSLSSVLVTPQEKGHGVLVTTQNISYCTTGMYRNALLTAGVEDADILVVAPTNLSGTAALIGALKGYEQMSGETVSSETMDVAMNELITTGALAIDSEGADAETIEALFAFVKAKVAGGDIKTDADIEAVIAEGEEKFNVQLTQDEKQQIIDVMKKIQALGLDPKMLVEQAEDLYNKFGTDFLNHIDAGEVAKVAGKNVFEKITGAIKRFFGGLFK